MKTIYAVSLAISFCLPALAYANVAPSNQDAKPGIVEQTSPPPLRDSDSASEVETRFAWLLAIVMAIVIIGGQILYAISSELQGRFPFSWPNFFRGLGSLFFAVFVLLVMLITMEKVGSRATVLETIEILLIPFAAFVSCYLTAQVIETINQIKENTDKLGEAVEADRVPPTASGDQEQSIGELQEETPAAKAEERPAPNLGNVESHKIEAAIREAINMSSGELTESDFWQVTELDLNNKRLTKIDALEGLKQLAVLKLGWNQLAEVETLAGLSHLETLNLSWNQLTDVSALAGLTRLEELDLYNNPDLTKAQIAELQKALPKCKIRSNHTK